MAEVQGRRTLSVDLPRSALAGGDVRLSLTSPAWTRGKDPRPRGVAVERVAWHPTSWMLPPARQILVLPLVAVELALLLLRVGADSRAARLVPPVAGGLLALAAGGRPLEVAPYTHRLLIGIILLQGTLTLWSVLVHTPCRKWWRLPATVSPTAILLLMGTCYWTFVAYHAALCLETRRFCPSLTAVVAGLGVLAGLIVSTWFPAPRRTVVALAVTAAGGAVQAIASGLLAFRRPAVDFLTLWTAAHDFSLGGSLYKPAEVAANHFGAVFKVPPFYGMLLLPFARTDVRTALALDRALDVALYLVCGTILVRWLQERLGARIALCAVAIVLGLMQPAFDAIAYGQIDVVLLLLVTLALLALQGGRPAIVGLAVALAALLKLIRWSSSLFLAARREWRAVAWTAAWLVALVAVAVAVMGWREHVVYVSEVLPRIGGGHGLGREPDRQRLPEPAARRGPPARAGPRPDGGPADVGRASPSSPARPRGWRPAPPSAAPPRRPSPSASSSS